MHYHVVRDSPGGATVYNTRNILDCDQSNYSSRIIFSCIPPELLIHESGSDNSFQGYGHSKFSKMAASRYLGFGPTGNSAIRSADLENPTLRSNTKSIGRPVAEIWPFEILQNARSVGLSVGRSSVLNIGPIHCSHVLLFATLGT